MRLEPLSEPHLSDVAALLDDPEVLRFTRVPEPPPGGFPRMWLERYDAARIDGTAEAFAALDDDGRFVGLALAPSIDRLVINVDNAASERVAARCGYTREGVMRSIHLKQDIRVDAALWSRLPSD
jgi:RimJ/RimL family protein N-acetyltransferase